MVKPGVIRKLLSLKFLLGTEQDHHKLHIIFKTFYNHHQEKGQATDPYYDATVPVSHLIALKCCTVSMNPFPCGDLLMKFSLKVKGLFVALPPVITTLFPHGDLFPHTT